jgi:hypothetical protein
MAPMLTHKTLKIIFAVLLHVRKNYVGGLSLIKAYRMAVREVASENQIFYQTVADGCCRRIKLDRDGFLDLVRDWLGGKPERLNDHIKSFVNEKDRLLVDDYFNEIVKPGRQVDDGHHFSMDSTQTSYKTISNGPSTEIMSFRISRKIAQQVKLMADMVSKSAPEWLSEVVEQTVETKYVNRLGEVIAIMTESERKNFITLLKSKH